jgi:hypothetical protein
MCPTCFNILALIAFGAISAGLTALVPGNLPVKTRRKNSDTQKSWSIGKAGQRANRKHLGDSPSKAARVEGRLTESLSC